MPQADSTDTTNPPITRQDVEAQINALIDLLDTLDADPDLEPDPDLEDEHDDEPSLGWTSGFMPESQRQEGRGFYMNENRGQDLEDEHDGREPGEDAEPDMDDEPSLGWTHNPNQTSASWQANHLGTVDRRTASAPCGSRGRLPRRAAKSVGDRFSCSSLQRGRR